MFSSSNNLYPFIISSSSSSNHLPPPPPPLLFGQETQEFFLHQNYPDPGSFSTPFFYSNPPMLGQPLTNFQSQNSSLMAKQETISYGVSSFLTKKVAKKDRHSKIYTAQGLRDRRVRLSIEISRKFFDLQDMLGFDKASKTLEWLLTQSRKAIKELARTKKKSLKSTSECEIFSEIEESDSGGTLERPLGSIRNLNSSERKCNLLAKQSRAKARERARARTMEKSKKIFEIEKLSSHGGSKNLLSEENYTAEEFMATKRKLKSKGDSSNNNNSFYFPNLPQNWDFNAAIAKSTEIQVYGKPWEAYNNQHLH